MSRRLLVISSLTILTTCVSPAVYANRMDVKATGIQIRQDVYATGTQIRQEARDTMMETRAASKEERMKLRAQFKEKWSQLKDERKKEIVEKLDARFVAVNKKATDHFLQVLDKLDSVLAKIETKAAEAKTAGRDTTALDADITTAANLIASARFEVTQQANKEYTITISTEDKLRMDVGKTASSFHADLRDVHKTVIDAKQAVMKAAASLAALKQ